MDWIVRIANQEYRTRSVEELRQWHREGRIQPGSIVFHPVLQRWMYPNELEELRGVSPVLPTPPSKPVVKTRFLMILLVLGIAFVGLVALMVALGRKSPEEEAEEARAVQERHQQVQAKLLSAAKIRMAALNPESRYEDVARTCSQVIQLDPNSLSPEQRGRCGRAHVAVARDEIQVGHLREAHVALDAARSEGTNAEDLRQLELKVKTIEDRDRRKTEAQARADSARQAKTNAENERSARKAYAELLRNRFLDQGLDINVRVDGRNSDRITLTFALFNAVWAHRMQKDGLLDELRGLGFKRVNLTDGYDYAVYWDFAKK